MLFKATIVFFSFNFFPSSLNMGLKWALCDFFTLEVSMSLTQWKKCPIEVVHCVVRVEGLLVLGDSLCDLEQI